MGRALYAIGLLLALSALWLTLSGRLTDPLVLSFGAGSVVFALLLARRMQILDEETSPFHRLFALAPYWGWLFVEIVKANIVVAREVLRADLDITPRLVRVPVVAKTDLGRTVFANSITLTPGTVTVQARQEELVVHALMGSIAHPDAFADMGERVARACEGRVS